MSVDTSGLAYNESNLTGLWKKIQYTEGSTLKIHRHTTIENVG